MKLIYYFFALKIYDWISGFISLGRSSIMGQAATKRVFGNLESSSLKGGIVYHDGVMDDARITILSIATSAYFGAYVLNYAKFDEFIMKVDVRRFGYNNFPQGFKFKKSVVKTAVDIY